MLLVYASAALLAALLTRMAFKKIFNSPDLETKLYASTLNRLKKKSRPLRNYHLKR